MLNSDAIKNFVLDRKNNLFENIALCLAVTLTSGFFSYDTYYFYMDFLRPVVSVLLIIIWLWCGFKSGINKKWGFLVFTGIYWLVPYLYMLFYKMDDSPEVFGSIPAMLNKFAMLGYERPMKGIADFTNCDINIWVLALAILTFTLYYVGVNVEYILRKKDEPEDAEEEETENKVD